MPYLIMQRKQGTGADVAFTSASLTRTFNNPNAFGTSASDQFGTEVAIDGDLAIVSAQNEDDAGGTDSGKVYIVQISTGNVLQTIDNPNDYGTSAGDRFGVGVDIKGNYAIVGAFQEDEAGQSSSGRAYIFNVNTGALVHNLYNPNAYGTAAGDRFGRAVGISDNYAVVTADLEDISGTSSGVAYVFDVASGNLVHTLDPEAGAAADLFGTTVDMDGNNIIIGAYNARVGSKTSQGVVYIYDAVTGNMLHRILDPNVTSTTSVDYFGLSVAISGNYAVAAAPREDTPGTSNLSGYAYIFDVATGTRLHTIANPTPAYNDQFGLGSMSASGNYCAIGAFQDDALGTDSGVVHVFDMVSGELVTTIENPNAYGAAANDRFGQRVALQGNKLLITAPQEDESGNSDSGKVYVYTLA